MSAVQFSLWGSDQSSASLSSVADLSQSFSKREAASIGRLIEKLWVNSEATLKESLAALWHQKYQHYTSEDLLIQNLSKRVMVDEHVIRDWAWRLDLPGIPKANIKRRPMNLVNSDYVNDDDELCDPLEAVISRTYRTQKQKALWDRYCRQQGILLPEEISAADIRYVLREAPISYQSFYAIFHQEPYSFLRYLDHCGLRIEGLTRFGVKVAVRTIIEKNPRIRSMIVRYAQNLYQNRGVPISTLANRIGIDPMELWRLGDAHGEWVLPDQSTLNHIIAQSVITHYI